MREVRRLRPRVVHLHDPELIPWGVGWKLMGYTVVFDAHEDIPASMRSKRYVRSSMRPALAVAARALIRMADRAFDAIVAATPSIARAYRSDRVVTVQNYPILSEWDIRPVGDREPGRLVYVGGITEARGAMQMLDALVVLAGDRDVRLTLAGPVGPASLFDEMQSHPGWKHVDYHPWLSRADVGTELRNASVGLVLFQPLPNHIESQPTKLFEYMAAGLPVVVSDFPLWTNLIEGEGIGVVVPPDEPARIAAAVRSLLDDPAGNDGRSGRAIAAVRDRYNWEPESRKLVDLYADLIGGHS